MNSINKLIVGVLVAVLLVGGVVIFVINNDTAEAPDNNQFSSTSTDQMNEADSRNRGEQAEEDSQDTLAKSINISEFRFVADDITVTAGTTVTWTNQDDAKHDVTPDQQSGNFQGSELLSEGQSYSYAFEKPGEYSYHCSPHPYMTAKVTVTEK